MLTCEGDQQEDGKSRSVGRGRQRPQWSTQETAWELGLGKQALSHAVAARHRPMLMGEVLLKKANV